MIGASIIILFTYSSLKHTLFHSTALDLGWFDQAVYLISKGQPPIVSFWGHHILGDHAALILYPLAILYKIFPDVHWLFAVQAVALALGAWPTWALARQAGLKEEQAIALAVVYLLYPEVFNVNLFDFHTEVIALPLLLAAVLAARLERIGWFCLSIVLILGCKEVLSLTVAAMGLWLLVFEKKRLYGVFALTAGVGWFLIASQEIIPFFSGGEVAAVGRYRYLGNSVFEIVSNLVIKPWLLLGRVISMSTLNYLVALLVPVIWGISLQHLAPLVCVLPTLLMNILSDISAQRDLAYQYSIPILPFLLLAVIATLAAGRGWLRNGRHIILWSLVAFLLMANYREIKSYTGTLDTWQAMRGAIAQIQTQGGVLTDNQYAPHVTHRPVVKLFYSDLPSAADLAEVNYVLLNVRHPWPEAQKSSVKLAAQLQKNQQFKLSYQRDDVYLFVNQNRPNK